MRNKRRIKTKKSTNSQFAHTHFFLFALLNRLKRFESIMGYPFKHRKQNKNIGKNMATLCNVCPFNSSTFMYILHLNNQIKWYSTKNSYEKKSGNHTTHNIFTSCCCCRCFSLFLFQRFTLNDWIVCSLQTNSKRRPYNDFQNLHCPKYLA